MHLPPLDVAVYPVVTINQDRHASRSARASSAVSSIYTSSSASSPICAPSANFSGIQRAIQSVFRSSKITVQKAERLPGRLHQVYRAQLADGSVFVLKCPPHVSSRALRHEKHGLETELKTLRYLRDYCQGQLPVPEVYQYQDHGGVLGSPFLLMSFVQGRKLAEMLPYLSTHERNAIDRTLGAYMRTITMLNAQQFGMTHNVFANKGSVSWREEFRALLESALRDCEDMLITLPYDKIRFYNEQSLHNLEEVQTPCMVAMDMCDPHSVLVDEQTKQVTGLIGFSNVIWGDPLMNEAIANGSDAFFEGYGERPPLSAGPHTRKLIYAIYRATVQIASLHYRPQPRVNDTDARRSLTYAINSLETILKS
ncbi:hypothetical protein PMIN01_10505 [Paraphaeosphaeria minitans]|uniref:Aminoglycoside phosphotransferase domain-containing protein n=1 Tax=Paraphaeosphaeria minitans TaxID=565426 RepID=A0A9P6GAE7_9PLEO|nr:hypothetical protein PMIN01_10505 [Paraphaeosphaeria minitans]